MHFRTPAALILAMAMAALPILPGCSPHLGGYDYHAGDARQAFSVYYGTAVTVQEVNINSQSSSRQTVGALIGAVAGGVIGSTIGSGSGQTLATVGGALLGGAAGAGAGDLSSRQTGLQITVRYDKGENEEVIVQGRDPYITPGQRVRVIISASGARRVEPAY
ncbi:glycine zipper 2TM domain-containing protein [Mailhella massiliensis]|uniref:Glycine zipper 2TM domain-containing protein n=1 Tax=Mailhella massiliensis TaxID=1903261 RepID=A0A921AW78_9BACT|nr:glycine zipper 2TM domain-containing protein [Mailhella massiliensis]HJD96989.1 glycine zipper 2TM domain-containing protein [Mailhella massiliensis]